MSGLDTETLEVYLTQLVRQTNYRGNLKIEFPIENPGVEIFNNHWMNRWRNTGWIVFAFILSFLWLFAWPYLFLRTKKYDVVKTVWPWSRVGDDGVKQYATLSEAQWFNRWSTCIERHVMQRKQGTLTEEDLQDEPIPPGSELSTGNATADRIIAGGVSAFRTVNRQLGWGHDE